MPADAVELRQRERGAAREGEHAPESFLKGFGINAFSHFILADDVMRFEYFAQVGVVELLAADVGENNAAAPREEQCALGAATVDGELRVALEQIDDFVGVLPGLFERIGGALDAGAGQQGGALAVDGLNGVEPPIFDFKHQQVTARVEDDKIRMHIVRAEGDVVPDQPVVFEFAFEALGEASFATRHARNAGADGGYE